MSVVVGRLRRHVCLHVRVAAPTKTMLISSTKWFADVVLMLAAAAAAALTSCLTLARPNYSVTLRRPRELLDPENVVGVDVVAAHVVK